MNALQMDLMQRAAHEVAALSELIPLKPIYCKSSYLIEATTARCCGPVRERRIKRGGGEEGLGGAF